MRGEVRAASRRIYLIKPVGMDGPIKIGCSHLPPQRLDALHSLSPVPLEIVATFPGTISLETNIHDCLAASHSHKEWFHATDKVRAFVRDMIAGRPIEEALDFAVREGCIRSKQRRAAPGSSRTIRSWQMRCYHAQRRASRDGGVLFFPTSEADAELRIIRAAKDGPLPKGFKPSALEAFLADPRTNGRTFGGSNQPAPAPEPAQ